MEWTETDEDVESMPQLPSVTSTCETPEITQKTLKSIIPLFCSHCLLTPSSRVFTLLRPARALSDFHAARATGLAGSAAATWTRECSRRTTSPQWSKFAFLAGPWPLLSLSLSLSFLVGQNSLSLDKI